MRMSVRTFTRLKFLKYAFITLIVTYVLNFFGIFTHIFEKEYTTNFKYPYEGDINNFVDQLDAGEKPAIPPLNVYNYSFILSSDHKCKKDASSPRLVYLVKSSLVNFNQRLAIRNSWGFEGRFSDVIIRRVFLLGVSKNDPALQKQIVKEHLKYRDIVQANFIDDYYNNTIKTMMGFKWVMDYCPHSLVYFFSDDDMYVSTKNVLRFIRNPTHYPHYLENPVLSMDHHRKKRETLDSELRVLNASISRNRLVQNFHSSQIVPNDTKIGLKLSKDTSAINNVSSSNFLTILNGSLSSQSRKSLQIMDFDLPEDALLWAGYVFISSPHRHRSSRWYVSLSEYPYAQWPPYVTAGAYVLSRNALRLLYFASMYTKHFKFDDIYLGIAASKIGLEPYHCEDFYFYKKDYNVHTYRYVIASHGYDNPRELLDVWNEQRSAGNA
ncbi:hypothetical protein J437_LFUL010788 [Ladona fulva]|uniref:Hexosyltransferase n=1 Tax=Ladona fulva TaxID=123851 RepID=A0A8K0NYT6_LADFU|nr:hypothetical protein J437_LFUL010788 [Ladona fulva]